jgi:hypothetical protein
VHPDHRGSLTVYGLGKLSKLDKVSFDELFCIKKLADPLTMLLWEKTNLV